MKKEKNKIQRPNSKEDSMKRLLMLTAAIFTINFVSGYTQDKAPSYFELDDYNHRYPATDTNIDFYLQNWKNSPVYSRSVMHGGWI